MMKKAALKFVWSLAFAGSVAVTAALVHTPAAATMATDCEYDGRFVCGSSDCERNMPCDDSGALAYWK